MSKDISIKVERKEKRTIDADTINTCIGCIGFILILAIAFGSLFAGSSDATRGNCLDCNASNGPATMPGQNMMSSNGASPDTQISKKISGSSLSYVNQMSGKTLDVDSTNGNQMPNKVMMMMNMTAQRMAAAARNKMALEANRGFSTQSLSFPADPGGIPHYYGPYPNYANSPAPIVNESGNITGGGIMKFVDSLPGLNAAGANNLGQYIPIAIPNTTLYPGSDYYEIELGQYTEKMHSNLSPTTLRGYRQTNTNDPNVSQFHNLGPLIIATRDTPVRIKFTNNLSIGEGGDLFLPVDTTIMGAGPFEINSTNFTDPTTVSGNFTQNRATIHLHGGFVPWISDGTPHQWITPAGETTDYPKGVSVEYVPDMWFDPITNATVPAGTEGATNNPGNGSMTFYYNNQQSARLQFYHDHSFGITRLNVYAGEAAGYLLKDEVEQDMIDGTNISGVNPDGLNVLPDVGIPLIIQDKTFVDNTTIATQDPTWNWGTGSRDANGSITDAITGDLWLPHVFMPNQNPADESGMSAFGRWFYSPWFFPAPVDIINGPIPNPYCLPTPGVDCSESVWPLENTLIPDVPNPSFAMEAFMDTPIVNGAAYPYLEVEPRTYRFRILNAGNDRFLNLQMYVADPNVITQDGRNNTEVKMVPALLNLSYPEGWPIDGREGGVPDPATAGPSFIQIGTEGGFLPAPVVLSNLPVDWNLDPTNFDMGVVNQGTLILGTAERADVIVDFSNFSGNTVILYNDAPAPFPAIDARYDYYTGNPDLRDIGGVNSTLAGYGPNTRTIMQFRVNNTTAAPPYNVTALQAVFAKTAGKRGVFEVSQDEIIVRQKAYQTAYNMTYPNDRFVGINDWYLNFSTSSGTNMNISFQPKAIHDEPSGVYSVDDGRMSAMLGLTTIGRPTTFIPIPYLSPPVEIIKDSVYGTPLGSFGDGTQIWKITHNGVDTHTIHVHLFNIQLINRVAWDNAIRKPDPNELGWKETLRVSPLQDTIVALRPVAPTQPFKVPNSIRPIDPTMPVGFPLKSPPFGWADIDGNPVSVLNNMVNFGWEYVYHCHLLGHEEMDMMHEVSLALAPDAPLIVAANSTVNSTDINLIDVQVWWTDNSTNEINFIVQRSGFNSSEGPWTTIATVPSTTGPSTGGLISYNDIGLQNNTIYFYRVNASNVVGDLTTYAAPAVGFPSIIVNSAPSNITASNGTVLPVAVTYANATPDTIRYDHGSQIAPGINVTNITVTVTGTVANVTINLSAIGGLATVQMNWVPGTNNYTISTNATEGINLTSNLYVNATNPDGQYNNSVSIPLTVLRLGDVVRNDRVNAADGYYILRVELGMFTPPSQSIYDLVGDANKNGIVNSADGYYILRYTIGKNPAP